MSSTTDPATVESRVFELLEGFGVDRVKLSLDARLDAIDVDSLDLVEIVQVMEDEYGITLDMQDFRSAAPETIGDVVDLVRGRLH